ncbi:hypothetical protein APA_2889 [Pseudanabaena sp. lw0831]|uniref:tetratricopeptide repeat protein n=1 Tax=Pseudanabaena sp. lw0831 TaxID=1357935 RepID=UPI0019153DCB|nr:tetratricopeptide repeat protein [Pseudanabaena sp. lw0831]GBO54838.1 hypothetical protein APA_2889 [Pseudanabaena sp. lw0831]
MTTSQTNILENAKNGQPDAIAALLNRNLKPKGITAKASVKNNCFWIMLEAAKIPPQKQLVEFVRQAFTKLEVHTYTTVKIYGKCVNEEIPDWHEDLAIVPKVSLSPEILAKQGDVKAITMLIKQWLDQHSDIAVKVSKKDDCLLIMLASVEVPDQQQISTKIQTELQNLQVESVTKLKIYGKQIGQEFPDWHLEIDVLPSITVLKSTVIESIVKPVFIPQSSKLEGAIWCNRVYEVLNEIGYQHLYHRAKSEDDNNIHEIVKSYIDNLEADLELDLNQIIREVTDLNIKFNIQMDLKRIQTFVSDLVTSDFSAVRLAIRDLNRVSNQVLSYDLPEDIDQVVTFFKEFSRGVSDVLNSEAKNKSAQGAATGAVIGSFFGPVVGTFIGAAIGGWIGGEMESEDIQNILKKYDQSRNKLLIEWDLFLQRVYKRLKDLITNLVQLELLTYQSIEQSNNLLHEANDYSDNVDTLEKAINLYNQAIELNPSLLPALFWRGSVLDDLGRYDEAIGSYDTALEVEPENAQVWYFRGIALYNSSKVEEAMSSYDKALQINPNYHKVWYCRGNILDSLEKYEEAILCYDKALTIEPNDSESWRSRGNSLLNLEMYEEAINSYTQAVKHNSELYQVWFSQGLILDDLERYEEALISFDRALQIHPDYHEAFCNQGNTLISLERYEESILSFDRALELNSNNADIWFNRGFSLHSLGRYEESILSYNKALEIAPNYHLTWYNKACIYSLQDQIELALENLQKAIQLDPEKCCEMSKTDSDFDNIRHDPRFQALIQ